MRTHNFTYGSYNFKFIFLEYFKSYKVVNLKRSNINNNNNSSQYGSRFRGVWGDLDVGNLTLPADLPIERLIPRDPQKPEFVKTIYKRKVSGKHFMVKTKDE